MVYHGAGLAIRDSLPCPCSRLPLESRVEIPSATQFSLTLHLLDDIAMIMRFLPRQTPLALNLFLAVSLGASICRAEQEVDFQRDVRPLLAKACFACHGNDAATREADLRLDLREHATAKNEGTRAIAPGSPQASELIRRIKSKDVDERMPPEEHLRQLTDDEIALLESWIKQGARYDRHWAFVKPQRAVAPTVRQREWPRGPIDHFVLAKLESRGMKPSAQADRFSLIRRLYLDLIGLPPSPAEVDAFLQNNSEQAYDELVEKLLDSPRFGERWGQMWLDLARYADSMGYEKDLPRTIWRYRDWVIDAFNADMPFDQFTIEQLAGDLLPNPTLEQRLATAMHRNTLTNQEGGTDDEEFRVAAVKDRVDTTMQVWMGLTMGCAKCHSHKFDPITQREYYQFYAFFNQTADRDRGDDAPTLVTPTPEQQKQIRLLDSQVAELQKSAAEDPPAKKKLEDLKKRRAAIKPPRTPIMQELPEGKRRKTHLQLRGNFLQRGDEVEAAVPTALGSLPKDTNADRLAMAHWLVARDNPLTARVQVNRIWARLFGQGIVLTEEDFGTQGIAPTHPELLDWLAVEYMENGWSLKKLLRTIVQSATYRQDSKISAELLRGDSTNQWLARGPRFRLEAEIVRDQALQIAGLLSEKMHGPSVMPPQPAGIWKVTYSALKWKTSSGEDSRRRSLYTYWRRTSPYPSMLTFDAASRETCVVRRVRTNTPLQALITLNDPVFIQAAGGLARRVLLSVEGSPGQRAEFAFRCAVIRKPDATERELIVQVFEDALEYYQKQEDQAAKLIKAAEADVPQATSQAEFAAWIIVGNVLLNLDEVMMKP